MYKKHPGHDGSSWTWPPEASWAQTGMPLSIITDPFAPGKVGEKGFRVQTILLPPHSCILSHPHPQMLSAIIHSLEGRESFG